MNEPLDFQSIMIALQRFWGEQGCLIWQPYYTQVGAGTMNPATILRVLGPEPWNVAYVEPSIRPDDGRYGENPNRLQQHYQYQVILKPDPGNPQELYLHSLEALGIDANKHDIRFVEDNWESPALGAWGLGWEVWLDGMEITQFTYFQQAGGMNLDPVSVEITYGLERISMALQRVRNFRDIQWNSSFTYGDVNLQGEQEHSKYYFEIADVNGLRQMYDLFEKEAETSLNNNLILPAHDYVLKCSHTFNVLDTRGAIGVTERQALFSRMRDLSRRVSEAYFAKRQEMGFPWIKNDKEKIPVRIDEKTHKATSPLAQVEKTNKHFLLEIGTEELPAGDLQSVITQLGDMVPALIDSHHLEHGDIKILGTPRRLVVSIESLASQQNDRTTIVKGPPADRAFDSNGNATKAGEGFARSKGLDVKDLEIREIDGGRYAAALVHEMGKNTDEVLIEVLPDLIAGIRFEKSMRWNESNIAFSRPIRWILAVNGNNCVFFEYAGIQSGRKTRLLRFSTPDEIEINEPSEYFSAIAREGIVLNQTERSQMILEQVEALAGKVNGVPVVDAALLDEVNNLVEAPTALLGKFDENYLQLPADVLISVMKKHQRYFPVKSAGGELMPYFIAVRNGGKEHLEVVADGNEQVIRARFADAAFFIKEDVKHTLEDLLPKLSTLTFQIKLGSMLDKSKRVEKLVNELAAHIQINEDDKKTALRAAHLCKADLVSHMVVEMTSLQGVMGRYYALHSGETPEVAEAIYEHYLPRYAGDNTPANITGLITGIADRLDTLMGLFAADLAPSGTKDPFAQRRAALGLVQNLITWDIDFNTNEGLKLAAKNLPINASEKSIIDCFDFINGRLRNLLLEQGFRYDVVDAVMAVQQNNPAGARRAVQSLTEWVSRSDWNVILPAFSRCVRITRDQTEQYQVDHSIINDEAEKNLYQALINVEKSPLSPGSVNDFLNAFLPIIPVINTFFDNVLVMAEDENVRKNRLGLLQRIASLTSDIADFSYLEGF